MTAYATQNAIVYRATNTVNGKFYIGYTGRGLRRRATAHFSRVKLNPSPRSVFHAAIRKYGPGAFVFEQVAFFGDDEELALAYESELIAKEKPPYNAAPGGAPLSHPATPEEAKARYGYWKGKVGNRKGAVASEETRALQRAARLGKPGPWAGKKRPGAAAAMKKLSERYQRETRCLDDGLVYSCAADAERFYGLRKGAISEGIRYNQRVRGRRFEYTVKK